MATVTRSDDSRAGRLPRPSSAVILCCALGLQAAACSGIDAGVDYPGDLPDVDQRVLTPEGEQDPSITLGEFKFHPDLCKDMDTRPVVKTLTPDDLTRYFEEQGVKVAPRKARGNLYWYDFPNGEDKGFVRLRVAVLDDPGLAAKDLHASLLEHGPGWWGVRRANLAVLAPKASLRTAAAFAVKYKLPCWGVFTYAGLDDAYVVPGPYGEL
jgi:hypothetical protein